MKEYLLGLWEKIKKGSIKLKLLILTLLVLYIGVLFVCLYQVEVDSSLPGTITDVSDVISIETENEKGKIATVSIYSHSKMSLLQYLLVKIDKNSEVSLGKSVSLEIFTENEEYASNVGYKQQSIQDSLIVAYNQAKNDGYDVSIDYSYKGQYLINIPQNLYKTGGEDFKNSDIIIGFNNEMFQSEEDYLNCLDNIFDIVSYDNKSVKQYKEEGRFDFYDENGNVIQDNVNLVANILSEFKEIETELTVPFKILRNNEEKEIIPSIKMLFYLYSRVVVKETDGSASLYTISENNFTSYTINYENCNPKINISKSDTVGPSGGLMQTLAVYNAITNDDVTKGKFVTGTGGITLDGKATIIGGEQQKVVTANLYGAQIFFVPKVNFESANEKYITLNTQMVIVSVESFSDVINYLKNMEVNNG